MVDQPVSFCDRRRWWQIRQVILLLSDKSLQTQIQTRSHFSVVHTKPHELIHELDSAVVFLRRLWSRGWQMNFFDCCVILSNSRISQKSVLHLSPTNLCLLRVLSTSGSRHCSLSATFTNIHAVSGTFLVEVIDYTLVPWPWHFIHLHSYTNTRWHQLPLLKGWVKCPFLGLLILLWLNILKFK